jgi:hypothetical protein
LAEAKAEMLAAKADGLRDSRNMQQFLLLGQLDHPRRLNAQLRERLERRIELSDAAVDED